MDQEPDMIRNEIEETRSDLTRKLESLEGQVKQTVASVTGSVEKTIETVKSTVEGTVETVKSTVEGTVESVRRAFDIPAQVGRHPWAMVGGSLATGVALGYLLGGRRGHAGRASRHESGWSRPAGEAFRAAPAPSYQPGYAAADGRETAREEGPGLLSSLLAPFSSEIQKVKETAIGTVFGMLRDTLKQSMPPALAGNVEEVMDNLARKLGGRPIEGPVLSREPRAECGPAGGYPG